MSGRKRTRAEVDAELARVSHERACLASALSYILRETRPDASDHYRPDDDSHVNVDLYGIDAVHGGIVIRRLDIREQRLIVEVETLDDWRSRMLRAGLAEWLPEREACERLNRARANLLAREAERDPTVGRIHTASGAS